MPGEENLATVTPHQTKMAPSRGLIRSNASRPYLKEYPSWGFVTQNRCLLGRPRISPLLSDFYKSKANTGMQNEARRSHNDGLPPAGTISRSATTGRRLQKTPRHPRNDDLSHERNPADARWQPTAYKCRQKQRAAARQQRRLRRSQLELVCGPSAAERQCLRTTTAYREGPSHTPAPCRERTARTHKR